MQNGGAMVEDLDKQQIKCPQCLRIWPIRSEQAAAVCKHGKCVACLVDDKEDFEPEHMLVVNTRKGVTTRGEAEKAQADAVKDLAGAASVMKAMGKPGTFQRMVQGDIPVWTADDDLDACGGERIPVRTMDGEGDHFVVVNDLPTTDDMTERRIAQAERVVALVKEWVELEFPPGTVCEDPNEADNRTFMEWLEDYRDQIFKAMALPAELLSESRGKTEPKPENLPPGYWSRGIIPGTTFSQWHWWPHGMSHVSACGDVPMPSQKKPERLERPTEIPRCAKCFDYWRDNKAALNASGG